jgi:hypothetical protein
MLRLLAALVAATRRPAARGREAGTKALADAAMHAAMRLRRNIFASVLLFGDLGFPVGFRAEFIPRFVTVSAAAL